MVYCSYAPYQRTAWTPDAFCSASPTVLKPCCRMSSCGIELTCAGTSSLATGSRVAVAFPPDAVTVSVVDTRPTDMTTSMAGVSARQRDRCETTVSKPAHRERQLEAARHQPRKTIAAALVGGRRRHLTCRLNSGPRSHRESRLRCRERYRIKKAAVRRSRVANAHRMMTGRTNLARSALIPCTSIEKLPTPKIQLPNKGLDCIGRH